MLAVTVEKGNNRLILDYAAAKDGNHHNYLI